MLRTTGIDGCATGGSEAIPPSWIRNSRSSCTRYGIPAAKVNALYAAIQPPGVDPMVDFDDRDLVRHAQDAGFPDISLELRVSVTSRREPVRWDRFVRTSGNPLIPTLQEAMDQALSPREADRFARHLRPLVESGTGVRRTALAYLGAVKS
jgi:arsenite methyltransferase